MLQDSFSGSGDERGYSLDSDQGILIYTEDLGLSREQVGRVLILGLDKDFALKIALRRKRGLDLLEKLRSIPPDLKKQIISLGKPGWQGPNDGYQFEYQLLKIRIEAETVRIFGSTLGDGLTNESYLAPFYAETVEEAKQYQAILFLLTIWATYKPYGVIPGQYPSCPDSLSKENYYETLIQILTIPEGILPSSHVNQPLGGIEKTRQLVGSRGYVEPSIIKPEEAFFNMNGIVLLKGGDLQYGIAWLEEAIVLGGIIRSGRRSVFPTIQKEVLDRFYMKHHTLIDDPNSEISRTFSRIANGYIPSKGIRDSVKASRGQVLPKAGSSSKRVRASVAIRTDSVLEKKEGGFQGLGHITGECKKRDSIRLSGCSDGTTFHMSIRESGREMRRREALVIGGCISLEDVEVDPYVDLVFILQDSMQRFFPLEIHSGSPIQDYCEKNSPTIETRVENAFIRLGKSVSAGDMISNWQYREFLALEIRKKGDLTSAKVYTPEDAIPFGDYSIYGAGEYELQFFPLGNSQLRKSFSPKTSFLRIRQKIEVGVAIETLPPSKEVIGVESALIQGGEQTDVTDLDKAFDIALLLEGGISEKVEVSMKKEDGTYQFRVHLDGEVLCFGTRNGENFSGKNRDIIASHGELLNELIRDCIEEYTLKEKKKEEENIMKLLGTPEFLLHEIYGEMVGIDDREDDIGPNFHELEQRYFHQRGFYYGAAVLQPWGREKIQEFTQRLDEAGVAIRIENTSGRLGELDVRVSLRGVTGISGEIFSRGGTYKIVTNAECPKRFLPELTGVLENIFLILGHIGWEGLNRKSESENLGRRTSKKPEVIGDRILDILRAPGRSRRKRNFELLSDVERVYQSLLQNNGKVCVGLRRDTLGVHEYAIHRRQGQEILDGDIPSLRIVVRDETISSLESHARGKPEVYSLIEMRPRLQKYLLSRILATLRESLPKGKAIIEREDIPPSDTRRSARTHIKKHDSDGKTPFTGDMRDVFELLWRSIDAEAQSRFIDTAKSSRGSALQIVLKDEKTIIPLLLDAWKSRGVQISYRRPYLMSVGEFRDVLGASEKYGINSEIQSA